MFTPSLSTILKGLTLLLEKLQKLQERNLQKAEEKRKEAIEIIYEAETLEAEAEKAGKVYTNISKLLD